MNKNALKSVLATLALSGTIGLAGCSSNDMGTMPMGTRTAGSTSTDASTSASANVSGQFNNADVTFAQMMIPHHEQAVQMSDTLLAKSGVNTDITALAGDINAAQAPEIATMKFWLKAWGRDDMSAMNHSSGGGMATADELAQFERADAETAQKMYLEMMTKHHAGAIVMAQTEINTGQNPDAIKLANRIVATQQEEITIMKNLLASL